MTAEAVVRTVLGDIDPESLGTLDYHEHLFQVSPLLPGDELDDETRSGDEARSLVQNGIKAMVEATPDGLGRNVAAVARISARTGLQIVHTTGAHHQDHYAPSHPLRSASETTLARRFLADVRSGFEEKDGSPIVLPDGTAIRAGLVKAGIRYWRIGPFERRVIDAAAATSRPTGCAVMVHLDYGSAAHEVLDLLDGLGVVPSRVVLAHIDRNLDPGLHCSLAERGAYLGYDGMARHREAPDAAILDCLARVVEAGFDRSIVLGGDVARSTRYVAYGGMPGLRYLPQRFLPRVAKRIGERAYQNITVHNGARLLCLTTT